MSARSDLMKGEMIVATTALQAASEKMKEWAPIDTGNLVHGKIKKESKHKPNTPIKELRAMTAKNGDLAYDGAGFKAVVGRGNNGVAQHTLEATARYAKWIRMHHGPIGMEIRGGWFIIGSKHAINAFNRVYEPEMGKQLQKYVYAKFAEKLRMGK